MKTKRPSLVLAILLASVGMTGGRAEGFAIQSFDRTGLLTFTAANVLTTTFSVASRAGFYKAVAFANAAHEGTCQVIDRIADNKMVFFMDIGSMYVAADGSIRTDLMPDNLHPNKAGYQLWLDAVKPKLNELMK